MSDLLEPLGEPSHYDKLTANGRAYARAAELSPHFRLVELRSSEDSDVVIVDALAGIPLRSPYGVQGCERLAVEVPHDLAKPPVIHALRADFPALPHQNLVGKGLPRQLCLSESPWEEDRSTETAPRRLWRITEWLERAGAGKLFAPGQALEPFLFAADSIIVPDELFASDPGDAFVVRSKGRLLSIERATAVEPTELSFVVMPLQTLATDTQVISEGPANFAELSELLEPLGVDLKRLVTEWTTDFTTHGRQELLDLEWLFLVRIPRTTQEGDVETELLAFVLHGITAGKLGEAFGVVVSGVGMTGLDLSTLVSGAVEKDLAVGTPLPLNPTPELTPAIAARMNGVSFEEPRDVKMVAVGLGALGSATVLSLIRQGFGEWTLFDHDIVMPHNLSRCPLPAAAVGHNKAECVAVLGREVHSGGVKTDFRPKNIHAVAEGDAEGAILVDAQVICDFTASRAALRRLGQFPSNARRVAAYLTASKRHLVVLAESSDRAARLDDLDVQLCLACASQDALSEVLVSESTEHVRYAGGCSDVTTIVDGNTMTMAAATTAARVRQILRDDSASIRLWEYDQNNLTTTTTHMVASPVTTVATATGWQIRVSEGAVSAMREIRASKLPNETGGVLLGSFDVHERIVYVAGVLPGPPDSDEWPDSYIRGCSGLCSQVDLIRKTSGGEVGYVGEWHSHPVGHAAILSERDLAALLDLTAAMGAEDLPGLVLVVSDDSWEVGLTISV